MTYQGQVELWEAINLLVVASGGKSNTSVARQKAVAAVESAVAGVVAASESIAKRQRDELVKAATDFRDLASLRDGRNTEDVLNEVLRSIAAAKRGGE